MPLFFGMGRLPVGTSPKTCLQHCKTQGPGVRSASWIMRLPLSFALALMGAWLSYADLYAAVSTAVAFSCCSFSSLCRRCFPYSIKPLFQKNLYTQIWCIILYFTRPVKTCFTPCLSQFYGNRAQNRDPFIQELDYRPDYKYNHISNGALPYNSF